MSQAEKSQTVTTTTTEANFKEVGEYRVAKVPEKDGGPNAGRYRVSKRTHGVLDTERLSDTAYAFGNTEDEAVSNCDRVADLNTGRQALVCLHALLMQPQLVKHISYGQSTSEEKKVVALAKKITALFQQEVLGSSLKESSVYKRNSR